MSSGHVVSANQLESLRYRHDHHSYSSTAVYLTERSLLVNAEARVALRRTQDASAAKPLKGIQTRG